MQAHSNIFHDRHRMVGFSAVHCQRWPGMGTQYRGQPGKIAGHYIHNTDLKTQHHSDYSTWYFICPFFVHYTHQPGGLSEAKRIQTEWWSDIKPIWVCTFSVTPTTSTHISGRMESKRETINIQQRKSSLNVNPLANNNQITYGTHYYVNITLRHGMAHRKDNGVH